ATDGQTLMQYLVDRFLNCQPPQWYQALCDLRWRSIWTLNIDDVLEQAYIRYPTTYSQSPIPLAWFDRHREADIASNQVNLIHLHGLLPPGTTSANLPPTMQPRLIFEIQAYLSAAR